AGFLRWAFNLRLVLHRIGLLGAQPILSVLQQSPCRKPAKLLEELRAEERCRIREGGAAVPERGLMLEALGDDEPRLFRRARFEQGHRASFLDAVDIGLGKNAANLPVKIFQTRDDDDRRWYAIGDLDEITDGLLEAVFRVLEEAQVFNLVDAENERGALHRPDQLANRLDDLEGTTVSAVRVERCNCRVREFVELTSLQVLPNALVNTRIATLQIEQRPHHVDVEVLVRKGRARNDLISQPQDELGKRPFIQIGLAQLLQ